MERLTGLDAGFLHLETTDHPMHGTHLAVLRDTRPGPPRAITMDDVAAHVAARLPALPSFRRRLVDVPLGLHHPVWIDDPDFALGDHLHELTLPAPGADAELDDALQVINGWPLPRRRPLWRLTLVHGLADGRTAFALTLHHAICDGRAVLAIFDVLLGPDAPKADARVPESVPSRRRLLREALRDHRRLLPTLPAFVVRAARASRRLARREAASSVALPTSREVPFTSLNVAFGPRRRFRRLTIPLDDLRAIRRGVGLTTNDVFLALITGAVGEYLSVRDEHPEGPLSVNVPVTTEGPDRPERTYGNHIGSIFLPLPIGEPDPRRRLAVIHEASIEAKHRFELVGPTLVEDLLDFGVPCLVRPLTGAYQARARRAMARGLPMRPSYHVVTSNLHGPTARYRVGPYLVEDLRMTGLITQGVGLMFTLFSYAGQARITITTNPDAVADPEPLVVGFRRALDELLRLVAEPHGAPAVLSTPA